MNESNLTTIEQIEVFLEGVQNVEFQVIPLGRRVDQHFAFRDAVEKGRRVLVVDDVLATGGTLAGACRLIEKVGGVVAGCACVVELGFLKGRARLKGRDLYTIVRY